MWSFVWIWQNINWESKVVFTFYIFIHIFRAFYPTWMNMILSHFFFCLWSDPFSSAFDLSLIGLFNLHLVTLVLPLTFLEPHLTYTLWPLFPFDLIALCPFSNRVDLHLLTFGFPWPLTIWPLLISFDLSLPITSFDHCYISDFVWPLSFDIRLT